MSVAYVVRSFTLYVRAICSTDAGIILFVPRGH